MPKYVISHARPEKGRAFNLNGSGDWIRTSDATGMNRVL